MKLTSWICIAPVLRVVSCLPNPAGGGESSTPVNRTSCNGRGYAYEELVGYGFIESDLRDKTGDTVGGPSALAFEPSSWTKTGEGSYEGRIWVLPDRGWNTQGTLNYQIRIHYFALSLTLRPETAAADDPAPPNLRFTYLDTILLTGPDGRPTTGLRPDKQGPYLSYPGFPILPSATYEGNGFGQPGPGDRRISIDSEGLVVAQDRSFWISDEYGPYIYQFSAEGRMLQAIQPPNAYLPRRNGSISFASDDPPIYDPDDDIVPEDVESGRANNQGFEGLTISADGQSLYALTQSALAQDGGTGNPNRRQARLIEYRISGRMAVYQAEYVVTLPVFDNGDSVAAQSEIYALGKDQFFVLARDSGAGRGQEETESLYRRVDVFDISNATNVKSPENDDSPTGSIADEDGNLDPGITPARYCTFLDFNVNSELAKFGLHNGGEQDESLLNEKWESLGLVPVEPDSGPGKTCDDDDGSKEEEEYFLLAFSDNDFVTQNGSVNFGQLPYSDDSGFSIHTQALVFRVTLSTKAS